mgnify:CR=1 FL=1
MNCRGFMQYRENESHITATTFENKSSIRTLNYTEMFKLTF